MIVLSPETEYKGKSFPLLAVEYRGKLKECTTRTKRTRRGGKAYLLYVDCSPEVEAQIMADNRFYILTGTVRADKEAPAANEFGELISYLAKNGYEVGDVRKSLGTSVGGRDREKITAELREYVQSLF